ncbi:hypothetical protein CASFOL_042934 [Castilleja foliolosa]|uniref:Ycf15 n=1 Tax=Castilleja foliolosa TaxID=1961234 RepID=A0ABD3B776_9LAMI
MVDTRDSKSRAKERGGSSPLQGIILNCSLNEQFNKRSRIESVLIYRFDPRSWNCNKFGSGSRNLGDLLYLMNGESALKSVD